jgi:LPS-assembly lipoprotein
MNRGAAVGAAAAVVVALSAMLGGCGFHLEGRYQLPAALTVVRIDTIDSESDFYFGLRRALLSAGARLTDNVKDPSAAVIHVLDDATTNVILAVSTLNVPTEYELTYSIRFSVEGAGGRRLIAPERLMRVLDYSYAENAQLAKQREQQVLTAAMGRELAAMVLRRLSSVQPRTAAITRTGS